MCRAVDSLWNKFERLLVSEFQFKRAAPAPAESTAVVQPAVHARPGETARVSAVKSTKRYVTHAFRAHARFRTSSTSRSFLAFAFSRLNFSDLGSSYVPTSPTTVAPPLGSSGRWKVSNAGVRDGAGCCHAATDVAVVVFTVKTTARARAICVRGFGISAQLEGL